MLSEDVKIKIIDFSNACWKSKHFSTKITTRNYRSPEVILGHSYSTSTDIWSVACTLFELLTGDYLFEPKQGINYPKEDDHIAQIVELIGEIP